MIYYYAYVSSSVGAFSKDQLLELLEGSRDRNAELDVTGMLLYRDGNILQMLEGPRENVLALVERIQKDPRHTGFIRLIEGEKAERDFDEWTMAFRDLKDPELEKIPGFHPFLNTPLTANEFSDKPSKCLTLLQSFKRSMS